MPDLKRKIHHYLIHTADGIVMPLATTVSDLENHIGEGTTATLATRLDRVIFHTLSLNRKGSDDAMSATLTEEQYKEVTALYSTVTN